MIYHINLFQKLPKVNKDLAEKLLDAEDSIMEKKTSKVILVHYHIQHKKSTYSYEHTLITLWVVYTK